MLKSGDGTQRRGWAACVPLLLMRWVHREEYRGGQERSGVLAASSGGTAIVFSVLGLGPSAAQLACESWYPLGPLLGVGASLGHKDEKRLAGLCVLVSPESH